MSHHIDVKIKSNDEETIVTCDFEDDEWRDLGLYVQYAEELYSVRIIKEGFNPNLSLRSQQGGPVILESEIPDWDDVIPFLHKLRPFILEGEPTYFFRIRNIISRRIDNKTTRELLALVKGIYTGHIIQSVEKITLNNVVLNSDQVVNDYLNAYEYHRDQEKRVKIDSLINAVPNDVVRSIILIMLIERAKAIFTLADFIMLLQGKMEVFELK